MSSRLVIMGAAGFDKSTLGAGLHEQLDIAYRDGDAFHSVEAVQTIRACISLTGDDRPTGGEHRPRDPA